MPLEPDDWVKAWCIEYFNKHPEALERRKRQRVQPSGDPPRVSREAHMSEHKPIIYFAGKIAKAGWRDSIVGYRAGSCSEPELLFDPKLTVDAGRFLYGGPFFVSCDHGCAHGARRHGAAAGGCNREFDLLTTRTKIWRVNCTRIKRADWVFAYINETDCYGTLVELGFAAALGKQIHVAFGRSVKLGDFDEMWMARELVECFGGRPWYGNVGSARETFSAFLARISPKYPHAHEAMQ